MNLNKWLQEIDGSCDLLSLNIPGTHDAATKYVWFSYISKTQNLTVMQQLALGVRALDIRVESRGQRLKMVHGIAKAFNTRNKLSHQMDLADVLSQCYAFLRENPGETIIFQFKNDSNKENEKCFNNLFYTYIKGNEDKWYLKNDIPALDMARGKIYLIRRCKMEKKAEFTDLNTGLDFSHWQEQIDAVPEPLVLKAGEGLSKTFIVQDRYKYPPRERWSDCISPFLDKAKPFSGEYIIDYLSTAGGLKGPKRNAAYINARFMEKSLKIGCYYGTVYCDFPDRALVEKIINLNFK
ncbi:MAG: phosphatidylinositol-specific phospholipase C domain-containing protein [Clostridiales bacterium]|nr:phosphatidylinositol-specific phospholipase C domain-containing protein [Clostridiales bacterium]